MDEVVGDLDPLQSQRERLRPEHVRFAHLAVVTRHQAAAVGVVHVLADPGVDDGARLVLRGLGADRGRPQLRGDDGEQHEDAAADGVVEDDRSELSNAQFSRQQGVFGFRLRALDCGERHECRTVAFANRGTLKAHHDRPRLA